jgi:hypothetical protein
MRALVAAVALLAAAAVALGVLLWREGDRARHLALPVLFDPSLPPGAPVELTELPACRTRPRARAPGRVTALHLASDRALWIGTFDQGVLRAPAGQAPRAVGGTEGRERFANDIAEHEGKIWVATQGGALVLSLDGRRLELIEPGTAVTALAQAAGRLYGGTSRGLLRLSLEGGVEPVEVRGPVGDPIRVNALAVSGATLWLGSWDGAYSLPLAALERLPPLSARWHPLVFGSPPAQTNVVTALAPLGDGALAGTDDGGLVRLSPAGVAAARFSEPRANEVNPGAAAPFGAGAVLGTQGGGLLIASLDQGFLRVGRPRGWPAAQVSALRATEAGLLAATADGRVLSVECDPAPVAQR